MHRVVESHLNSFKDQHGISLNESRSFEAFCAFSVARVYSFDTVEPETLIYEGDDPGIDSMIISANDKIISTLEEISALFSTKKNDNEISIAFIQSKTSESWSKAEVNNFESAVLDFVSDDPVHKMAPFLQEKRQIFDEIIKNLGRVKAGKPSITCYFVTTARENDAIEIDNAVAAFQKRLSDTGLFISSDVQLLGRDKIINLYIATKGGYEAKFGIIGSASFPKSPGNEESYVVTVLAKNFIDHVLDDGNGNIRKTIFDENVRDFIDFEESSINEGIGKSLEKQETRRRFGILNNGVTIVSPDVRLQSNEIYISDYQIVNGCQTSNVIFKSKSVIDQDATLMVKIIETSDQKIVDEIVKSTNSQNKIEDHQFLATMDCIKNIEQYFKVRNVDNDQRLYFERRPNQFSNDGIPNIRIFNIKELARCCGAMFFDRPDLSARYPNQLVEDLRNMVFNIKNREEIFFTSSFAQYRMKLLLSNQRIDPVFNQLKWHALMAIKYHLIGKEIPDVASKKIESVCNIIVDFMSKTDPETMATWQKIADSLKALSYSDRDTLRTTRFTSEVRERVLEDRPQS